MTFEPNDTFDTGNPGSKTMLAGRYALLSQLGQGTGGEVYLAEDIQLANSPRVALKILRQGAINPRAVERFKREVLVLRKLSHENIVQVFEFAAHTQSEHAPPLYFFVMEYVPGTTARQFFDGRTPLPFSQILHLYTQLLKALEHAHSQGVIHRDVKPENLLITPEGVVKLADFGVATAADDTPNAELTGVSEILGTPAYLAPELLQGERASPQSDLYSAACVCIELLNGEPLHTTGTYYELYQQKRNGIGLTIRRSDVPPWFLEILTRATHPDREERFASAEAILQKIADAEAHALIKCNSILHKRAPVGLVVFVFILPVVFALVAVLARANKGIQLDFFKLLLPDSFDDAPPLLQTWLDYQPTQIQEYLHEALKKGQYDTTKLLINNGASVRIMTRPQDSPIVLAIARNDKRILELVMQHGARFSMVPGSTTWKSLFRVAPALLEVAMRYEVPPRALPDEHAGMLDFAVLSGTLEHVQFMLEQELKLTNGDPKNPLILLLGIERCRTNPSPMSTQIMKVLIEWERAHASDWNEIRTKAMSAAVVIKRWDILEMLLAASGYSREDILVALPYALADFNFELLRRYLRKGWASDGDLINVLFVQAIQLKRPDIIRFVAQEAASINVKDKYGVGLVYYTMLLDDQETLQYLLNFPGFDLSQVETEGRGPLMWTADTGRYEIFRILLKTAMPVVDIQKQRTLFLELVRFAPYEILEAYLQRNGPTDWDLTEEPVALLALENPDVRVFQRVLVDPELQGCPTEAAQLIAKMSKLPANESTEMYRAFTAKN